MGYFLGDNGFEVRFLAKHLLFKVPVVGPFLRWWGMIPVLRGSDQVGDALKYAHEALAKGDVVGIDSRDSDTGPWVLAHEGQDWPGTPRVGYQGAGGPGLCSGARRTSWIAMLGCRSTGGGRVCSSACCRRSTTRILKGILRITRALQSHRAPAARPW